MKLSRKLIGSAARICAVAISAAVLGGWDDDADRVEFVTRGFGDAVEVNKATQTIDPWPKYVKNRKLVMDGHRAAMAMKRYQANDVIKPNPLNATLAKEQTNSAPTSATPPELQQ